MDGSVVLARWRQCAPPLIHASMDSHESIPQTASRSIQPFLNSSRQRVLRFIMGRPFLPQNCPFTWGNMDPHLIHGSLGPPESTTQMASLGVQPFLHGSRLWQTSYSVFNNTPRLRGTVILLRCGLIVAKLWTQMNGKQKALDNRGLLCMYIGFYYFSHRSGCEVLWWMHRSVHLCVCLSDLQNHTCSLFRIFCASFLSMARSSSGMLTICRIAYRREGVFFPIDNAL